MTQFPLKQNEASNSSFSQSEGELREASDGLDPNADVQQRAMLRYERQLQSDPQLQVQSQPHQIHTCQQSAMYLPALGLHPGTQLDCINRLQRIPQLPQPCSDMHLCGTCRAVHVQ